MEDIAKNLTVFRKSCKTVCIRPRTLKLGPYGSIQENKTAYRYPVCDVVVVQGSGSFLAERAMEA